MPINFLNHYQHRIERVLHQILPYSHPLYPTLAEAVRYSAYMNGGKRLRPTLTYMTAALLGTPLYRVDTPAAAIECVHCFSLIHDDLPAIDNADIRRGQPSCHKVFGEDMAILTGDALLSLAFELLTTRQTLSETKRLKMIQLLSQSTSNMIAGQVADIKNTALTNYSLDTLQQLHQLKTGALLKTSILLGAIPCLEQQSTEYDQLAQFGEQFGLLYQICDDILDVVADTMTLGKAAGSDKALGKRTFVDLLGLAGARQHAKNLCDSAIEQLERFSETSELITLTLFVYKRTL